MQSFYPGGLQTPTVKVQTFANNRKKRLMVHGGQPQVAPPPVGSGQMALHPLDASDDDGNAGGAPDPDDHMRGIDSTWDEQPMPATGIYAAGMQPAPASERELPGVRRGRTDEQWAGSYENTTAGYCLHLASIKGLHAKRQCSEEACYLAHISEELECCPHCGAGQPSVHHHRDVLRVGIEWRLPLRVPVMQCNGCSSRYSVTPLQLGCIPAAPSTGSDLCTGDGANCDAVVWLGLELLEWLHLQVGCHAFEGCSAPLGFAASAIQHSTSHSMPFS